MRERIVRRLMPAFFAFLAAGISSPQNDAKSVTVPLSSGTYYVNSENLCIDVSAENWLKSTLRIKMLSRYCTQKETLSTGIVILPPVNLRDRIFAQVDMNNGEIIRITQLDRKKPK